MRRVREGSEAPPTSQPVPFSRLLKGFEEWILMSERVTSPPIYHIRRAAFEVFALEREGAAHFDQVLLFFARSQA